MYHSKNRFILVLLIMALVMGCTTGGLVPAPGEVLTDKDIALDKYHQALKWTNNMMDNLMANLQLLPVEDRKTWVLRIDPIKKSMDTVLTGWNTAIGSGDYVTLNENRAEFKRLKNSLLDVVLDLALVLG